MNVSLHLLWHSISVRTKKTSFWELTRLQSREPHKEPVVVFKRVPEWEIFKSQREHRGFRGQVFVFDVRSNLCESKDRKKRHQITAQFK